MCLPAAQQGLWAQSLVSPTSRPRAHAWVQSQAALVGFSISLTEGLAAWAQLQQLCDHGPPFPLLGPGFLLGTPGFGAVASVPGSDEQVR